MTSNCDIITWSQNISRRQKVKLLGDVIMWRHWGPFSTESFFEINFSLVKRKNIFKDETNKYGDQIFKIWPRKNRFLTSVSVASSLSYRQSVDVITTTTSSSSCTDRFKNKFDFSQIFWVEAYLGPPPIETPSHLSQCNLLKAACSRGTRLGDF